MAKKGFNTELSDLSHHRWDRSRSRVEMTRMPSKTAEDWGNCNSACHWGMSIWISAATDHREAFPGAVEVGEETVEFKG